MYSKLVPFSLKEHKDIKIKKLNNFDFIKDQNVASILIHEFSKTASTNPIVFIKDKSSDQFKPVILLGLESGENLFVQNGSWSSSYIPAVIRRFPFALVQNPNDHSKLTLCIDEESHLVSTTEGEALFSPEGAPSVLLENVRKFLTELQQMEALTQKFCSYLEEKELFSPMNLKVKASGQTKDIKGCFVINEERLNNLSDDTFLEIRNAKYLAPIYTHLTSLAQIERLVKLKEQNFKN